jgi:hypothetical protein
MVNQLKKDLDLQEIIFERIKKEVPSQISIVNTISELFNISTDAAYRRIRGEKRMDIDELNILCQNYNISIDTIFGLQSDNNVIFCYKPLDLSNFEVYVQYTKGLAHTFELMKNAKEKEILFAAIDIPVFHFLRFKDLMLFKIFAWTNSVYKFDGDFVSFVNNIKCPELFDCYKKIVDDYSQIPSIEIWTENTIDTVLRLLDFYFETRYLNTEIALHLCSNLLELVDHLQEWAEKGQKGLSPVNSSFKLYVSEVDLENSYTLLKKDGVRQCMVKLYTINSMSTYNDAFCDETERWINNAISRSTLMSGASERERIKFFQVMKQKVRFLVDKIEKSNVVKSTGYKSLY